MNPKHLLGLIKWFCSKLTYNDLSSAIIILLDVLSNKRKDISLKREQKPPNYCSFKIDPHRPLTEPPDYSSQPEFDWKQLKTEYEKAHGKKLSPVRRRKSSYTLPKDCRCIHCNAPSEYLYLNDGKKANQVLCKICKKLGSTHRVRRQSNAKYYCPYCGYALYIYKKKLTSTTYKCPNRKCSCYIDNFNALTPEERKMYKSGNTSVFKLHYSYKEYILDFNKLKCAFLKSPTQKQLATIRSNIHIISLILTYFVNLGLSSRQTRDALIKIHGVKKLSHQTVINYINMVAALLNKFAFQNMPKPKGIAVADETYISVNNQTHYSYFSLDAETRAISGFNLSDKRDSSSALALIINTYGLPSDNLDKQYEYVSDGLRSYDQAVLSYNSSANQDIIISHKVIGLKNLDDESSEFREFKQMIERLNRTYKFHTRPRAGFKSFDGALALSILFIIFYNHMRPHSALKGNVPVPIPILDNSLLYPQMWATLIANAI